VNMLGLWKKYRTYCALVGTSGQDACPSSRGIGLIAAQAREVGKLARGSRECLGDASYLIKRSVLSETSRYIGGIHTAHLGSCISSWIN
jgi:hypothetical protein